LITDNNTIGDIILALTTDFKNKGKNTEDAIRICIDFNDRFKQKFYGEYLENQTKYIKHRNENFQRYIKAYYGVDVE